MKRFLKRLLLFILPIVILAYPLDILVSQILRKTNLHYGEYEVWDDIYASNIDADLAIFGSSRAWRHFDPKIFEDSLGLKTYNFGMDGHNFWMQQLRHRKYFAKNPHPQTIIYSVDILTLVKRVDLFNKNQLLPFMLFDDEIYNYTKSYQGFSWANYYVPLYRYATNLDFSSFISDSLFQEYRYHGFKGADRKWNLDLQEAELQYPNFSLDEDTPSVALFISFIEDMKRENIDIILVCAPEYYEGQDFVKNRVELISTFKEIAENYSLPFFDYSDSAISKRQDLFYNTLHLNKEGAEVFTQKFIRDWQRLK